MCNAQLASLDFAAWVDVWDAQQDIFVDKDWFTTTPEAHVPSGVVSGWHIKFLLDQPNGCHYHENVLTQAPGQRDLGSSVAKCVSVHSGDPYLVVCHDETLLC